ncbi:MAG: hypothetical protein IT450_19380 [Phycisphaerales bacterium]|nr:hypothetical protein [Phycisphaerales bacterium]
MIPPFDDLGNLPPGIHPATLPEIKSRFGVASELRRAQMESVVWMVDLARRAGIRRIILNGSFVTDIMDPNDVDCVLLLPGTQPADPNAFRELRKGLPFIGLTLVFQKGFDKMVGHVFASDRQGASKGMVEVIT